MDRPLGEVDLGVDDHPGEELHRIMHRARNAGPIVPVRFMGTEAHLLTTFDAVRTFLSDDDQFPGGVIYRYSTRPSVGSTFIDLDGEDHHRVRRLATPAFRSRAVRRFVDDELTPLADEVLDEMLAAGLDDLVEGYVRVLPFWSISRKLGLPVGTEERQRTWALALLSHPTDPEGARRAADAVTEFLLPTLAERRATPRDDVVSRLLTAEVDGAGLTDEQVAAHVRLLYAVGATTTSDGLGTLLRRTLTEPGLWERLRADRSLLPAVVHESLRTEPPVALLPRLAVDGGEVAGVELPPGALVLCGIAAANRDPAVFSDPDRFNPERPETEVLTFGFGSKFCPGSHLARQQLAAATDVLLERLGGVRVVDAPEPTGPVLRRIERLVVEPLPAT
ncbi:MAG: cytochrome P450 [Actinobacteria bacterium]|nr:cytochrome P450 [Actinomycetota bacterium]